MQTQKISLANMQGKLNRMEMKNVLGGSYPVDSGGSRGCCWHNANWTHSQCGYQLASEAQQGASINAQGSGQHYYWCCASC